MRLERGVQRAAEEQLLAGAVDQRDQQHDGDGAGIGGGQHTVEGGADEGKVPGDQVGGEEHHESGDAGHDGSDDSRPCHLAIGLEGDRPGDE